MDRIVMFQTIEVEIDAGGRIDPAEPLEHPPANRALLTPLTPGKDNIETALLAEPVLAEDWLKSEEDVAWAHLQPDSASFCPFLFQT